jgi:uncharacterized repeat protein (TIGR03803 family)
MRNKRLSIELTLLFVVFALITFVGGTLAAAQTETVLYGFNSSGAGGDYPAGVVVDKAGNLYGTTVYGGSGSCPQLDGGCGTVFELSPNGKGGWTKKTLHNFAKNGKDGFFPTAGLVFDKAGNLYGTTQQGGTHHYGTVYELTPQANGNWTEKILHNFSYNGTDGIVPNGGLVFDGAGNLYGMTFEGGLISCSPFFLGCGTVFELSPAAEGRWTETILHNFSNDGTDGYAPCCGALILDRAGNLYGVTGGGGTDNYGAAFELTPAAGGNWTETVLHSFSFGTGDGYFPQGSLTLDGQGNLYGTTVYGGVYSHGTVFELTPAGGGSWTETILHSFDQTIGGPDGSAPSSDLIFDSAGNLYGTTGAGGIYGLGLVFELSPAAGGTWTEAFLHNFQQTFPGTDGYTPGPMLVFDAAGNLYGTTVYGGAEAGGTVFELTP